MEDKEKLWSMLNPEKRAPQNAVNFLIGLCQKYPQFKVPFFALNRLQADLFNNDLWVKADQLADNNRAIAQLFFRKAPIPEPADMISGNKKLSSDELKLRQGQIIEKYMSNKISFTEPLSKK
jgi:hypothetical protein